MFAPIFADSLTELRQDTLWLSKTLGSVGPRLIVVLLCETVMEPGRIPRANLHRRLTYRSVIVDKRGREVDPTRIRQCPICNTIFWAGRSDKVCCSRRCGHTLAGRRYRENQKGGS